MAETPSDSDGTALPGAVASMQEVELGGTAQSGPDFVPVGTAPAAAPSSPAEIRPAEAPAAADHAALAPQDVEQAGLLAQTFAALRGALLKLLPDEIMFVLSAGQSLSLGATQLDRAATLWSGPVDADRAHMLDFDHAGIGARGWNYIPLDPALYLGMEPMESRVTETPAPAMAAQILDAYDSTGRLAPDLLHFGTGAIGASLVELMTGAEDLATGLAAGLRQSGEGDLFALARADGRYDYYLDHDGAAVALGTFRHAPGLWDTMEAQIGFAAAAAAAEGYQVGSTVAIGFVHGQADARLDHPDFGYAWLASRYFDMIETAMADIAGIADPRLVVALAQVAGDADGNVPLGQLDLIRDDPRVVYGGTQMEFQSLYPSTGGSDHIHLSPQGYLHLGETLGHYLGEALIGRAEDPILVSSVTALAPDLLEVAFSGVGTRLVEDRSIFEDNPAISAPDHFGFALSRPDGTRLAIEEAWISGADTVRLRLAETASGAMHLSLGLHGQDLSDRIDDGAYESWNGTSLRDAAAEAAVLPQGYDGDLRAILEFAPTQEADFWL
ncbi:hypothetical protein [Poseidonocella sp. HB161398]|uniref:hypothetical protein n=1 Tax=Poseidonocella sp. HB161398 TaxID=2320855 RepID=UPI0011093C6A|nr:hypothetical protein [Poseidonocella sp. HB161398]